eukprot:CAMPEP_0196652278 /NCGR_PEP_ID=MMETSP1086-20130531/1517_1 /TAXON_ID=77921 /ORGANISM="Cyanoptyche  gloeocystis , Strain SAG4.97" /LENGTH=75 /DNA_ID=CAMNT_0041982725 /DNA_START=29 /DNA_END=256 /DNA_ORIENTATION=-
MFVVGVLNVHRQVLSLSKDSSLSTQQEKYPKTGKEMYWVEKSPNADTPKRKHFETKTSEKAEPKGHPTRKQDYWI